MIAPTAPSHPVDGAQHRAVLAIDIGGTKMAAALVGEDGTVLRADRAPTPRLGADEVFAALRDLIGRVRGDRQPLAAGIGSAGPLDGVRGLVSPVNIAVWRDFPLVDRVRAAVGDVPVTLGVDAHCFALGEAWTGAGRGVDDLLGIVVSTGVGGGLVLGGRAAPSPTGNGGHIGHIEVGGFDDACACGGRGCLEAVASGPRTVAWARTQGFTGETGEELALAHAEGDPIAIAAVARAGGAIGHAVASATNLLDLDVVAIGGGFARVSAALFDHARAALDERHAFPFVSRVRIVPSGLSDEGPLIGAAALVHRPEFLA
jgi:glucokinase